MYESSHGLLIHVFNKTGMKAMECLIIPMQESVRIILAKVLYHQKSVKIMQLEKDYIRNKTQGERKT